MARNYIFAPGEYYHLYARGVEKMTVFREQPDYQRFLDGLYLFNSEQKRIEVRDVKRSCGGLTSAELFAVPRGDTLVDIGAYCLMPNHFHILVKEKEQDGKGISTFMQRLMTSYTMYFNKKNQRTGAVFGSAFKAQHVTEDTHLKYLFAYIHLNPKKLTGARDLKKYAYSSYSDYGNKKRPQQSIVAPAAFPDYFSGAIEKEMNEWLAIEEGNAGKFAEV